MFLDARIVCPIQIVTAYLIPSPLWSFGEGSFVNCWRTAVPSPISVVLHRSWIPKKIKKIQNSDSSGDKEDKHSCKNSEDGGGETQLFVAERARAALASLLHLALRVWIHRNFRRGSTDRRFLVFCSDKFGFLFFRASHSPLNRCKA